MPETMLFILTRSGKGFSCFICHKIRTDEMGIGVSSKKVWVDKIFAVAMKKRSIDNAALP